MKKSESTETLALLAIGSCRHWEISVDESIDGDECFLEMDGPQHYLVFQLRELAVVAEMLRFLQLCSPGRPSNKEEIRELRLGCFGQAAVSLVWDNEDMPRCFVIVGPQAGSAFRIALDAEDIQMISEALRQVAEELP